MALRITTWIVFAISCFFAFYTVFLPSEYFIFDKSNYHLSDYLIGWFWMTVYAFVPSILMVLLLFIQRKHAKRLVKFIWMVPVVIVFSSALFMKFAPY